MQFRTELVLPESDFKISHQQKILGIGSCFTDSIGQKLADSKFQTLINPFGTLFHPLAIENALTRIHSLISYSKSEIFKYGELYFSWDHHSSFNRISADETLKAINSKLDEANDFIRDTDVFLLTFGTAWVYKLKEADLTVANCHKIPGTHFEKFLLSDQQIKASVRNCFELIRDINPKARIITTVSPVRHTKDGIVENNLSKSKLISNLFEVVRNYENADYFPAYELVMDDLRDYRFYKEDLVHPNDMAVNYIWEKFSDVYFSDETKNNIETAQKIKTAMNHRPLNAGTLAHKEFLYKQLKNIRNVESRFPLGSFESEKTLLEKLMKNAD